MIIKKINDDFKSTYRHVLRKKYFPQLSKNFDYNKLNFILDGVENKYRTCLKNHNVYVMNDFRPLTILPNSILPTVYCDSCRKIILDEQSQLLSINYKDSNSSNNLEKYINLLLEHKTDFSSLYDIIDNTGFRGTISFDELYIYLKKIIFNNYSDFYDKINYVYNGNFFKEEDILNKMTYVIYLSMLEMDESYSSILFIDEMRIDVFRDDKSIKIKDYIEDLYNHPHKFQLLENYYRWIDDLGIHQLISNK